LNQLPGLDALHLFISLSRGELCQEQREERQYVFGRKTSITFNAKSILAQGVFNSRFQELLTSHDVEVRETGEKRKSTKLVANFKTSNLLTFILYSLQNRHRVVKGIIDTVWGREGGLRLLTWETKLTAEKRENEIR